jgi:hypothetical protein
MDNTDIAAVVDGLMAAAGIRPTDQERARLVATYPLHREAVDALYAIDDVRYESPGTIFVAEPGFADWAS